MTTHKLTVLLTALVLIFAALPVISETHQPADTPSELDRFKALAGTWEGTVIHNDGEPEPATVTFRVTAGGSAVIETEFAGTEHEMITVFHLVDGQLTLTHYCMLGNQPTMQAQEGEDPGHVRFDYADGTNIDPGKDMHMHAAEYRFIDNDHITSTWTLYNEGQPTGNATLDLKRKKD